MRTSSIQKKKRHVPQFSDFGPNERLARGEVIITGERQYRRGRAVDIVMMMPKTEREAAAMLLALWEAAEYQGYACASLVRSTGGNHGTPSDRAAGARKTLARISNALKKWQWSVIFHVLFMGETHSRYAFRARISARLVTSQLRRALSAVAELRAGKVLP